MQNGDSEVVKSQQAFTAHSMARTMLEVTAVGAIQLPDIEVMRGFGVKMDSYLALQLGSSTAKTKKAYGGGRNPNWQQVLHLELQPGTSDLYITVWKYSKISQHEEIARGSMSLPAWQQQGEQSWDQRVALQPARMGKGSAWGGEVLLKLKYTTIEDASSSTDSSMLGASLDSSYQSSSLPIPALQSNGEQPQSSAGASASLSRLMNKLQKPRKSRVSSDTVPVPSQPVDISGTATNGEVPVGHSPRQSSQFLQKALDKVLKRVGGKEKERSSAISEGGYATAEESDTVSRRSSIASLTEPPVAVQEMVSAAPVASAVERHRIMPPTWQQAEQTPVLPTHTSTSTQTDSPVMHASDSSHAFSQPSREPSREAPFLPCQSDMSLSPHMSSLQGSELIAEETGLAVLAAEGPPSRASQSSSEGPQAGQAHSAATQHPDRIASFPTPPSPFAAVQEEPLLVETAQSSRGSTQPGAAIPEGAASGVPADGGSASSVSAPLGAPQPSAESAPAAAQVGRVRLEHLDTAYRRREQSTSSADARGSTSSEINGHAPASSASVPESDAGASGANGSVDMAYDSPQLPVVAGPSSPAVPFCPAPHRGFVEVQPLGSPFADHSFMDRIIMGRGPASDLDRGTNGHLDPLTAHPLRQTGLMPDEDLQAGIKTMPLRIPPLPDAISSQENGCSSEEENGGGSPRIYEADAHIGPLALQPRLSAAPEDDEDEHAEVVVEEPPTERVMRKTLSRKSPFLPELLQGWNDYSDIIFCEEYGKKVLLGEGSFGEVYKASYLDCDIAVKKLNRINDAKSEEAFRRECAILKGCRHPHIVNFMGVCKDEEGRICLMTELMDTSLMSALLLPDDANKEFHYFNQGRHILICVAKALIYLHKHDIVHLDVKSPNVLLKKGDAKLADVGLSQMLSKSFANSCSGMGTFSWAATELLLGSHPVTTAADIFSFGVLLWEVCTLEQPHLRHMRDITEDEAPEQIRQLFSDCVREDPNSRPTAKQVLQILMQNQ
ncbi:probable serine/threonine-protein kinase DDB_G0281745 at C-terminar half [Coccomyxa sp. Obi]|nr:probable serine/threonine-protein kinase DDB_G0281745 at C-terminar half [Coccomyxa sp. Obi]